MIEVTAYPKINIFLKITDFSDGLHILFSRFALVKNYLADDISIKIGDKFSIKGNFDCEIKNNSIKKVIDSLSLHVDTEIADEMAHLQIEVDKKIPIGAGLGGGSSDAGAVLIALCKYYSIAKSSSELASISKVAGEDVKFFSFVYNKNINRADMINNDFYVCQSDACDRFEIYTPNIICDTKAVYKQFQANIKKQKAEYFKDILSLKYLGDMAMLNKYDRVFLNDLYMPSVELYKELKKLDLDDKWHFSGSGSSFFRAI